ncbi:MAG TPA: DUF5678 domain-containing protein [Thermoanaerobaculia bacterium]|jgi:hypothetical protein
MSARAARRHDPEPEAPTPESFLEEIRAILNSGTLRGAREVAERGLALYPDHHELKHVHHELRPFQVRSRPDLRMDDPRPSYKWLEENADKYRGKWVGLDAGELVAAADTLDEVLKALRDRDPKSTLIHHLL